MHMSVLYVSDLCVFLTCTCTHNLNELKIKSLDKPFLSSSLWPTPTNNKFKDKRKNR